MSHYRKVDERVQLKQQCCPKEIRQQKIAKVD